MQNQLDHKSGRWKVARINWKLRVNVKNAKAALDEVYKSVGDVVGAKSVGQLPWGPSQIYSWGHAAKNKSNRESKTFEKIDEEEVGVGFKGLSILLERAKCKEEANDDIVIRESNIHPNSSVVLASNCQLQQLEQFCTNTLQPCILGVDPVFNIFQKNVSLTVTRYRNPRHLSDDTGKHLQSLTKLLSHP